MRASRVPTGTSRTLCHSHLSPNTSPQTPDSPTHPPTHPHPADTRTHTHGPPPTNPPHPHAWCASSRLPETKHQRDVPVQRGRRAAGGHLRPISGCQGGGSGGGDALHDPRGAEADHHRCPRETPHHQLHHGNQGPSDGQHLSQVCMHVLLLSCGFAHTRPGSPLSSVCSLALHAPAQPLPHTSKTLGKLFSSPGYSF